MKRVTSTLVFVASCTLFAGTAWSDSSQSAGASEDTKPESGEEYFKDLEERFSYAYGIDLAEQFKREGIDLNIDLLTMAMKEVFSDSERKMSDGEVAATIEVYQEIHRNRKEAERAVIAEKNREAGEAFLAANAREQGVVVTESGLQYRIIRNGNGGPTPTEDDQVTVHYRAMVIDGGEFDSTHSRNEPFTVRVNRLIDGWSEALQLMTEGAKWELYIPAELAYGDQGSEQYVEPGATLIFEVELLGINQDS